MKHKFSKIGQYGITLKPVEGYINKNGKKVLPHMKKVEFKWKDNWSHQLIYLNIYLILNSNYTNYF